MWNMILHEENMEVQKKKILHFKVMRVMRANPPHPARAMGYAGRA